MYPTARRRAALVVGAVALLIACGSAGPGRNGGRPAVPQGRAEFTIERDIVYASPQGEALRGDLYVPRGEGPLPTVVVVHGGSWRRGRKESMAPVAEGLAASGYVAFTIDYRLTPTSQFPAQLDDCRAAVRWLRANAATRRVDPSRLAGFGYSAGGHLVALLATANDLPGDAPGPMPRLRAAAIGGAPVDLRRFRDNRIMTALLGGTQAEVPDRYAVASPITHVTPDDPPMFLYHGRSDWMVDVEQARAMQAALRAAGVPAELYETGFGHVATFLFADDAVADAIRFFDRWLKPAPPA